MFYSQIIMNKGLPFEVNAETVKAIKQVNPERV